MSADITIAWDDLSGAWHLHGATAGPAGTAEVELGGASWRFDWSEPSILVEAMVEVADDSFESPLAQSAIDAVERICGVEVARALATLPGRRSAPVTVQIDPATAGSRVLAGRLALALELADASQSSTWWDVEAVAAASALGAAPDDALLGRAFEVVDPAPPALLDALARAGLAEPLATVLSRVGLAANELPPALQLGAEQIDERFAQLVVGLSAEPVSLGSELIAPTFRRSSEGVADEQDVEWIDAPAGVLRRATWRLEDGAALVTLGAVGPLPAWLRVRVVDLAGRVPEVLDEQAPQVRSTRDGLTTSSAELAVRSGAELRVELVDVRSDAVVAAEQRPRRHAIERSRAAASSERHADAEVRVGTDRARNAVRLAARQWAAAREAWELAGDPDQAERCGRRRQRLAVLAEGSQSGSEEAGSTAGWTESVVALAHQHLSGVPTSVEPERSADEAGDLAALAESSGELEAAARLRAQQARALRGQESAGAIARLALRHFEQLGMRAPRDLTSLGAPFG